MEMLITALFLLGLGFVIVWSRAQVSKALLTERTAQRDETLVELRAFRNQHAIKTGYTAIYSADGKPNIVPPTDQPLMQVIKPPFAAAEDAWEAEAEESEKLTLSAFKANGSCIPDLTPEYKQALREQYGK